MSQGQMAYSLDFADAVPGKIADNEDGTDIISMVAGEAIPYGRFVAYNPTDGKCYLPALDADQIVGVAVFVTTLMGSYPQGNPTINAGDTFAVLRRGRVFADYDTGTQVPFAHPRVCNDAAQATKKGKATMAAAAADSVRPEAGGVCFYGAARTDTMALLEVRLDGAKGYSVEITGALSTVADAAAKAVLTSIISCLVTDGRAKQATT